jgi:hypothetical protein
MVSPAVKLMLTSGGKKPVTPAMQADHTALVGRVEQLEVELKKIMNSVGYQNLKNADPGTIGHNNPPEDIVENPLDAESIAQLKGALQTIKAQPVSPNDRGRQAKNVAAVLNAQKEKWSAWMARHGDTFVDAAVKEAGKRSVQSIYGAMAVLVAHMTGVMELLYIWLKHFS